MMHLPMVSLPRVSTGPFRYGLGPANTQRPRDDAPAQEWLTRLYASYVTAPMAQRHTELWQWVDALQPGARPRPLVAIWPRGGAKSTSAELACVRVGYRRARSYVWYVSSTQDKADKHVESIGALLESTTLERADPGLASRRLGKYGYSKGWRRSRLRTASGLTVDALGLDTGARGAKVEEQRPDLIIIDDVDERHDSPATTKKKIEMITSTVLPAGAPDLAVLFIQNVIHPDSIAARLVDGRADFLADRVISGPYPAIDGLTYEQGADGKYYITAGVPTWAGQSIEVCQGQIHTWGLTAFLQESQHQVEVSGGIWDHIEFRHCAPDQVPDLVRAVVWCDPAVTDTDESCANGIVCDGIAADGTIYRLFAWEAVDSPAGVLRRAIQIALDYRAEHVGVETNQGGDLWKGAYKTVLETMQGETRKRGVRWPRFREAKAGAGTGGKIERNQRMLVDYEKGMIVHVTGSTDVLERALKRFPGEPLDLADAAYWGWSDLRGKQKLRSGRVDLYGENKPRSVSGEKPPARTDSAVEEILAAYEQ